MSSTLLANFETLADAPNAIPKLRELILQLAVRGRLVPQDPDDEPASGLLSRIRAERHRQVDKGVLQARSELPPVSAREVPRNLPASWGWARIGAVTTYGEAAKTEPGSVREGTWVLELEDIEKSTSRLLTRQRFPDRAFRSTKAEFRRGDVLYGKLRPYLDKVLVADEDGVCTTEIIPLRGLGDIDPAYLRLALKSPDFIAFASESTHGMNLPRLATEKARMAVIPVPPHAEQKRIVAKVDELMALCDELEAKQQKKRAVRITLNRACLRAVTQPNGDSLRNAWHRVRDHFDDLYCVPETVAELRQTILQLAVMGRLVPQDPNDEHASVLLKKVQAEKRRLVAEGVTRGAKALAPMASAGEPHILPRTWEWVHLDDICEAIVDTDHKMPKAIESGGYPYVSARDLLDDGTIDIAGAKRVSKEDFIRLSRKVVPRRHDVVYSRIGTVGKARLVMTDEPFLTSYSCCLVRPIRGAVHERFLVYLLESSLVLDQARGGTTGIGVPDLGLNTIRSFMIALAPMAEQRRIVARVDALITLCDDLEARLQHVQASADGLLAAIVRDSASRVRGAARD